METKNTESPIIRRELGPLSYNVKNIGYEINRAFDELTGPNGEGLEDFILDFLPTGRIKKVDKLGKQVLKLIKGGGKPGTAEVLMKRGELTNVQGVLDTFDKAIRNIQLSKALTSRKANIKHDKAAQEDWFMKAYYTFKDYADKYDEVIDPKIFTNRVVSIAKELQIKPIKGMDLTFKDSIKGLIPLNMTDPFYGSDDNIFNSDVLATRAVARDIYNKSQSNKYVTTEALLRSYGDPGKLAKQIAVFTGINALGNKTGASSILPVHNPTKLAIITSGLINALTDTATYNEVYRKMFTNPRSAHDIGYWGSKKLVNQPTAEKLPDVPLTEYFPPQIKEITDGYLQEGNLVNQTIKRTKFVQEPEAPKEQPNPDIIKEFINQIRR